MADTLRLTQQCPSGGCYTITDRGTLQQLIDNGAVTALPIVMDAQDAGARGGSALMINQYRGYALDPARVPAAKTEGALAFLDFLTARGFQRRLRSFPTREEPGFFAAAFPVVDLARAPRRTVSARRPLVLRGSIASAVPGAAPLDGAALRLTRFTSALTGRTLARDTTGGRGRVPAALAARSQREAVPDRAALPRPQPAAALARPREGARGGDAQRAAEHRIRSRACAAAPGRRRAAAARA